MLFEQSADRIGVSVDVVSTRIPIQEVDAALEVIGGWRRRGQVIETVFDFGSFADAFAFMTAVAVVVEQHGHHPTWQNTYGKVAITLTSHDHGGITDADLDLAVAINQVAEGRLRR